MTTSTIPTTTTTEAEAETETETETDITKYNEQQNNTEVGIPSPRQQIIGVTLVISVAIIWVVSAEFIQYIFADDSSNYNKPYTLSYICVSLFFVFLFGFFKSSWRSVFHRSHTYEPVDDLPTTSTTTTVQTLPSPSSSSSSASRTLNFKQVVKLSTILAPLFFSCNWTFNLGLAYTSVASSSIIATLTSIFTLILGAITGVEKFSMTKCIAACFSVSGAIIIILADQSSSPSSSSNASKSTNPLLGDIVSIVSAFIYATYTTVLKSQAPTEGSVNVAMLLSFIGLFTAFAAWPGIFILDWLHLEPFEWPSKRTALLLLINALIGTVLSDFLWALSVVLTTPLVTTLSLSLTVPLSIFMDVLKKRKFSLSYFIGATLVFFGFALVNIAVTIARRTKASSSQQRNVSR